MTWLLGKANTHKPPTSQPEIEAKNMTTANNEKLEGTTLSVYLYVVKKGAPVGPRDAMKGANLSSPSVAYRHLQKLEDLGYLKKNEYGEYITKKRARIRGFIWVGRRLMSKMLAYSFIFLGALIVELAILSVHYSVENLEFVIFFLLLTLVTASAMAVFMIEGFLQHRRTRRSAQSEQVTA
jgi:DNA-binding transcriptional ArsR family regulator